MRKIDNYKHVDINALKDLSEENLQLLSSESKTIMNSIVERIHYAEARRSQFLIIAGTLVAAGVAILQTLPDSDFTKLNIFVCSFSIGIIVTGFSIFFLYSRQTNYKYPFNSITTTWKWFYRDALVGLSDIEIPFTCINHKIKTENTRERMLIVWEEFFTQYKSGITDKYESLHQDIQQIYILHLNEKYKNYFLSNLRRLLVVGISITLLMSIISLFAF